MIYMKKREKESPESLLRRFSRRVQQTTLIRTIRKSRFHDAGKSKRVRRIDALYKVNIRKHITRMKKLGTFNDEALREIRRKM
jgi:ribosomal protein S21